MATSPLLIDTEKCYEIIVDIITDIRRKHKLADYRSIHKEVSTLVKKTL